MAEMSIELTWSTLPFRTISETFARRGSLSSPALESAECVVPDTPSCAVHHVRATREQTCLENKRVFARRGNSLYVIPAIPCFFP